MNTASRAQRTAQNRELLRSAQVSPKAFTAFYSAITILLNLLDYFVTQPEIAGIFVSFFTTLCGWVLSAGFALYCMGVRRRERMEFAALFDGFSFVGKIILLNLVVSLFTGLWSMLFFLPGIIAHYRYRFAFYNLYENPELNIMTALELSKRQTRGIKLELFKLDLSYLGWILLAMLPSLLFDAASFLTVAHGSISAFLSTATPLWQIVAGVVWANLMALFYLPTYQCVLLDYFDTAKASAPGADSFRQEDTADDSWGF